MAPTTVPTSNELRTSFKSFWDKYSDRPDIGAMMLNNNAEELEEADRHDILSSLPCIKGKDAVDIGAGIGRFTTVLAQTARHVLTTDFIDEFIKKNRENNSHLVNVDYAVGDACNLQLKDDSVDFVFTNWIMMYMSDTETVQFILKCLTWLRPNGHAHLRESCSEPSTGRKAASVSMHDANASNPTSYRFSSLYINLLRSVRVKDENGDNWKFNVRWSASVPTYIKRMSNWRQVHWLVQKVPADNNESVPTFDDLLEKFSKTWNDVQKEWDSLLDGEEEVFTDEIVTSSLSSLSSLSFPSDPCGIFVYTPRRISPHLHVNSHLLAEQFSANIWNVESEPYYYRTSLTKANTRKDQRVRFAWHPKFSQSIDYWTEKAAKFDAFVSTEFLTENDADLCAVKRILNDNSPVVLIEPLKKIDADKIIERLSTAGLKNIRVRDVTDEISTTLSSFNAKHNITIPSVKRWALIEATV
ncbi:pmt-1 [Pristionchus pacificus]|uniref:phosphoethanolamine N-methyltransferase n=1 Tax=Pristionchus pacificus TaxID=54126 RepID=A0A2A6D3Q7_PRIPA|nr:pmt-1 [Pristionchus pacificus]|eukprot:PDM84881.1 pmt-1 [Pristionchus pacificus]